MLNTDVKQIKTTQREIFRYWLEFLKPFHKLANKEIEAMSSLLYYRHELSKEIKSPDLIDKLLFSKDMRQQVRNDLGGMKNGVFNNLLTVLRRKKVLSTDNKIFPFLIPKFQPEAKGFKLILNFEIDETKSSR